MFNIFGNNEAAQELAAEKRAMNFNREQSTFQVGNDADSSIKDAMFQEQKSDLIRWQQQLGDEMQDLVFILKGYRKQGSVWTIPDDPTALCNDLFIDEVIIPQCTPFISRNLINSNFQEERILMMLRTTMDDIADNMADCYDKYDIDFINNDLILRLIKNTIKPGAFRSLNGWTKKTDSTIFKRVESSFDNKNEQQQKKIFGIPI